MNLDKYEKALFYEIFIKGEYKVLDDIIRKADVIFDIGGHIGLWSLYVLTVKTFAEAKLRGDNLDISGSSYESGNLNIHFFDPVPDNCVKAKTLLSMFQDCIIFNELGISSENGEKIFHNARIPMQSSLIASFLNKGGYDEKREFRRLTDYMALNSIIGIDLLKMDIEGEEFDVLLDLDGAELSKIKSIFLEFHILDDKFKAKYDELLTKLEKHYISIEITASRYDPRLGYIFCKNG